MLTGDAGMKVPFFGPTLYWGRMPFWKVPDEHWQTYLAESERSDLRYIAGLFTVAAVIGFAGWMLQ